ncbi:MAG: reprolysin-like metallopeptidase [Bacteroidota bacterium]
MKKSFLTFIVVITSITFSKADVSDWFKPVKQESIKNEKLARRNSTPSSAYFYEIDLQKLKNELATAPLRGTINAAPVVINFPNAYGKIEQFKVYESPIMHRDLASKYPMIKTYAAQGITDPTSTMRFSITQFGLHTMTISGLHASNYIDPYTSNGKFIIVYDKHSLSSSNQNFECTTPDAAELPSLRNGGTPMQFDANDQIFRTYRLAQSCTAEYGNIFALTPGQEVADIQAQMTITMNRVNGVFERDLAVTMEFVPDNDTLIFYGSTTADPWSNEWNTKTAQTIDARIGVNNYDIGHNFNTTGGGNAGCIACVCLSTSQSGTHKGRGMTGSPNPTGDPFDIDYVAHEMGHQFGGYHVMNTCSRSGSGNTEVEPASGSSIMGYAGICSSNVQSNSDDDFNYVNVRDITANIQTGNSTCAFQSPITNQPPTADAGPNYTIPKGTAFILEGIATDPDGIASLTYNWGQNDPAQSPGNAAPQPTYNVGPMYRSISPQPSPNRYMPNLRSVVLNNLTPTWEVTPSVARTMNFSFIVRDNDIQGGQTASDLMTVTVDNAGPFVVTSQNTTVTWNAGTSETITWNVANTNNATVNCQNVNIYLSLDSGYTYPYTLATGVPNNGSAVVTVPAGATTTTGRIMVRGAGNIFYALNTSLITIQSSEFVMNFSTANQNLCLPNDALYNFNYQTFLSFSDTTTFSVSGLPSGATATFNPATAVNDGTPVLLTISGLTNSMVGNYNLTITGTSASVTKSTNVALNILESNLNAVTLTSPSNSATGIATAAQLSWTTITSPGVTYAVEISTDSLFSNIVASASNINSGNYSATGLLPSSTYYWHVTATNDCGSSPVSGFYSFSTNACANNISLNVPVSISGNGSPSYTSTLTVNLLGTINDINVIGLIGTHSWINDMTFNITGPNGAVCTLFDQICSDEDDFDVNFDDQATPGALPCPPVGGGTFQPSTPLSIFNGIAASGTWTLNIIDNANQDGGSVDNWGLEICTNTSVGVATFTTSNGFVVFPNPSTAIFHIRKNTLSNEKCNLRLTNTLGQMIVANEIMTNQNYDMDLSNLESGIYFITVTTNEKSETQKIYLAK